jgi:steroid delta-isomerase-like uncharacterized protein
MSSIGVRLRVVNLVVRDLTASLRFYRDLGVDVPAGDGETVHLETRMPGGLILAWDRREMVEGYDPAFAGTAGDNASVEFWLDAREEVDRTYASMVERGHAGRVAPFDAFWGLRYAVLVDPDGHLVALGASDPHRVRDADAAVGERLVRQLYAAFDARDPDALDEILLPEYVDHDAEDLRSFFAWATRVFPDARITIDAVFGSADRVAAHIVLQGTHRDELLGVPATGKQVTFAGIDLFRVEAGRLAEHWGLADRNALLAQLRAGTAST